MTPITQEPVTTGELGRNLEKFEKTVTEALGAISTKLDDRPSWTDVRNIEAGLKEDIAKLDDWQKWAVRAILLAVLGAVVAAVQIVGIR